MAPDPRPAQAAGAATITQAKLSGPADVIILLSLLLGLWLTGNSLYYLV
jgi:hypothetical protein